MVCSAVILYKYNFLMILSHTVNSVCIRSFSGPYFPAFGLNAEIYSENPHIQSEWGKKNKDQKNF